MPKTHSAISERTILVVTLLTVFVSSTRAQETSVEPAAIVSSSDVKRKSRCSYANSRDLETYLLRATHEISIAEFSYTWDQKTSKLYELFAQMTGTLTICESKLKELNSRGHFTRLMEYANQRMLQLRGDGHSAGFILSDKDYLKQMPKECRNMPPEFKDGLPDIWVNSSVKTRTAMAHDRGWERPPVTYSSQWIGNKPYDSYQRMLFHVPDGKVQKFTVFTLPEPGSTKQETGLEQICVVPGTPKTKIYFAQFNRDGKGMNPKVRIESKSGPKYFDMCMHCHPSGLRGITPAEGSVGVDQIKILADYNRLFNSFGPIEMPGTMDERYAGPPLGASVGCTSCHTGDKSSEFKRGALYMNAEFLHEFKVKDDLTMPPGLVSPLVSKLLGMAESVKNLQTGRQRRFSEGGTRPKLKVIEELYDRNLISESDFKKAKHELLSTHARQKSLIEKMRHDDQESLSQWLLK